MPESGHNEEDEDISLELEEETTTARPRRSTTPVPLPRQNHLYTIFPTLQKEDDWRRYCPVNQYTFQVTCLPGKKLRYDLQVRNSWQILCQEFSEKCGVPNVNLYPSRHANPADEGRPKGYGQKQQNGQLGLGRSWAFGLGAILGLLTVFLPVYPVLIYRFEVTSSQGTDIGAGNLPFLNQVLFLALSLAIHNIPHLVSLGAPTNGDKKLSQEVLNSFGIPNIPALKNLFGKLGGNRPKKPVVGYEPGYGAVNPNAPLAIGKVQFLIACYCFKTDVDAINLPGGFGDVETLKGGGFGFGK
ncbi:hypothetical protein COOONC_20237 [Cooperia oncophora]